MCATVSLLIYKFRRTVVTASKFWVGNTLDPEDPSAAHLIFPVFLADQRATGNFSSLTSYGNQSKAAVEVKNI
jgi:hypothetical protein